MKRRTAKGLREIKIVPGKSMDEIDNASFGAGPPPMASRPTTVNLRAGEAEHPPGAPVLHLDGAWEMACEGAEQDRLSGVWQDGIPVRVPGSVHTALVEAGRLPDPVVGRNQLLAAEHSYKTWWLRRTFVGPADTDGAQLVFDGVANRCTVWLNGKKLGGHEGMFGGPEYDVSKLLRDENTLVVKLDAVELPEGVKIGDSNESWRTTVVFNNSYGWHYSHCPPLGIWRSVRIEGAPAVRVDHPFVATRDAGKKEVDLAVTLSGRSRTWSGKLVGTIRPENYDGPSRTFSLKVRSQKPTRDIHLRFRMPKAQLWWPRGIGEPNLHRMRLSFVPSRGGLPVTKEITFGIRTVEMAPLPGRVDSGVDRTPRPGVPRPDKFNWTFVINGRPMFVKGTGWCSPDAWTSRASATTGS